MAKSNDSDTDTMNIHQRIMSIKRALNGKGPLAKDGAVEIKGTKAYDYVSHDAVTAFVAEELVEFGVNAVPTVITHTQNGNRTELGVDVSYVNVYAPSDYIVIRIVGYGVDSGDKGPGKAMSYAIKVAHQKMFCLNSFDDQGGEQIEHQTHDRAVDQAKQSAEKRVNEADQLTLTNLKKAIGSAQSTEALAELDTTNKKWLAGMPEITQEYFRDAFKSRSTELSAA